MTKWDTSPEIAGHPDEKNSGARNAAKDKPGDEPPRKKRNQKWLAKRQTPGFEEQPVRMTR